MGRSRDEGVEPARYADRRRDRRLRRVVQALTIGASLTASGCEQAVDDLVRFLIALVITSAIYGAGLLASLVATVFAHRAPRRRATLGLAFVLTAATGLGCIVAGSYYAAPPKTLSRALIAYLALLPPVLLLASQLRLAVLHLSSEARWPSFLAALPPPALWLLVGAVWLGSAVGVLPWLPFPDMPPPRDPPAIAQRVGDEYDYPCVLYEGGRVACTHRGDSRMIWGVDDAREIWVREGTACARRSGDRVTCWREPYAHGEMWTDRDSIAQVVVVRHQVVFLDAGGGVSVWPDGQPIELPPITAIALEGSESVVATTRDGARWVFDPLSPDPFPR